MTKTTPVTLYDTTLRDGTQGEGINFSSTDKIHLAERLRDFGVHYIEGGWPGSNQKDVAFFEKAKEIDWGQAKIAAFGSTRRANISPAEDKQVQLLLAAETPVVTIFGKSSVLHVEEVLRTTLEENLEMIRSTVAYLTENGREVVYDAEHFFDGFKLDNDYTLKTIQAAAEGGASYVVLCDTNGGTLPSEISDITRKALESVTCKVGIHTHNDCGLGVANAVAAVEAGATQVQGTINGYGERTGNCNMTSVMPILQLKMELPILPEDRLKDLTKLSHFVDELANQNQDHRAPFVGVSSFAHKGGMHVNAVNKTNVSYEHIKPETVGNRQRILVGELSGGANIMMKARELGIELNEKSPETRSILMKVKELEEQGYEFEAADASFELLIARELDHHKPFFDLLEYHVAMRKNSEHQFANCESTVKILIDGELIHTVDNGDGPVNALDNSLRKALKEKYPVVTNIRLIDYKVRIIDSGSGTGARIRVLVESSDGSSEWGTVGVSDNVIEASYLALVDSIKYFLMKSAQLKQG